MFLFILRTCSEMKIVAACQLNGKFRVESLFDSLALLAWGVMIQVSGADGVGRSIRWLRKVGRKRQKREREIRNGTKYETRLGANSPKPTLELFKKKWGGEQIFKVNRLGKFHHVRSRRRGACVCLRGLGIFYSFYYSPPSLLLCFLFSKVPMDFCFFIHISWKCFNVSKCLTILIIAWMIFVRFLWVT